VSAVEEESYQDRKMKKTILTLLPMMMAVAALPAGYDH
jgi:hypothetical protein